MEIITIAGLAVLSFLLGSIPFGLIISKLFFKTDIRQHGSGNIGTTNAMRTIGKAGGAAVFLLDFGKGLLSGVLALVACWYGIPGGGLRPEVMPTYDEMLALSLCACTLGHIFSPWLKFRGGKGIAVAVGCVFVSFGPVGALLEIAIFVIMVVIFRYVSLGSIAAAAACPLFALYFFWGDWVAVILCVITASVVIWAHRENIRRLMAGTERRVGAKKTNS